MLFTREFYEAMKIFEAYAKEHVRVGTMGFKREPKENWKKQWYYSDREANNAFKVFLCGYSFGKTV